MDTSEMHRIGETIGKQVEDLFVDNRAEIKEIWAASEEIAITVSFSVKLSGALVAPQIYTKLSFSKKITDEVTEQLADVDQTVLPFQTKEA